VRFEPVELVVAAANHTFPAWAEDPPPLFAGDFAEFDGRHIHVQLMRIHKGRRSVRCNIYSGSRFRALLRSSDHCVRIFSGSRPVGAIAKKPISYRFIRPSLSRLTNADGSSSPAMPKSRTFRS